jgi:hypothetical protein
MTSKKKPTAKKLTQKGLPRRPSSTKKEQLKKKSSKGDWQRPYFVVLGSTEFPGYAILTVIPGVQYDMGPAVTLAQQMKASDRIYDWRPAGAPRGLSIILKPGTTAAERLAIADEFIALGYQVIERPS